MLAKSIDFRGFLVEKATATAGFMEKGEMIRKVIPVQFQNKWDANKSLSVWQCQFGVPILMQFLLSRPTLLPAKLLA